MKTNSLVCNVFVARSVLIQELPVVVKSAGLLDLAFCGVVRRKNLYIFDLCDLAQPLPIMPTLRSLVLAVLASLNCKDPDCW
jgi:hypothetical protein